MLILQFGLWFNARQAALAAAQAGARSPAQEAASSRGLAGGRAEHAAGEYYASLHTKLLSKVDARTAAAAAGPMCTSR